ncbi:MAG: hypothetical protein JWM12_3831 [Ilumatobacteraceae bacterium]|nr:hypothetical protein [Ilumatobacteraceae bacterium]
MRDERGNGEAVPSLCAVSRREVAVLVIRRSEPADVSRCVQLARDAHVPVYTSMREIYGDELFDRLRPDWSGVQAAQIAAWLKDPLAPTWVAELDGVAVGFIVTSLNPHAGMGMVEVIAVHPTQQRQGIGGRLVSQALDHLRDAGVAYVEAYIRDFPGHEPAHGALRSQGFTRRAVHACPALPDDRASRPTCTSAATDPPPRR